LTTSQRNTPEYQTRIRLRRQLMALYSYTLVWLGIVAGMELGIFDPETPHGWIFFFIYASNAVVYVAIRTGASRLLNDPSLTVAQMVIGILGITAILHYANEIRGAMLSIYFMVMTFGVFALDRFKMLMMSLFIMTCYTALVLWEWQTYSENQIFGISLSQWTILALGLTWFVYVGGHMYNLQQRIREQRESLRDNQQRLSESNNRLQSAMERLAEIAVRDSLTGLFNRRHFLERLDEELALAERGGRHLHVALIDLDHFKKVNDQHGHQVGDQVLRKFADVARRELRRSDVIARYGGEEFIVLFNEGSTADIQQVLERLRVQFALACRNDINSQLQATLSAGLAVWQADDRAETITLRADRALYQAKHKGRNRLAVA